MPQFRAILFDKDGTLFDFQRTWGAWASTIIAELAAGDAAVEWALADAMSFDRASARFRPESPVIAGTGDEVAALLAPHLPLQVDGLSGLNARLARAAESAPLVEAVPLDPLLTRLVASGLQLGVVTNDHERTARRHLAPHLHHFDYIAGFDSGHGAKPGPGMLLAFCRQFDLAPGQVLMVGDSRHDLIAGRDAGMPTLAVLTGVASAADLAPLASHVCPDIGHIPELLAGLH